jgi:hypothetical protein
LEKAAIDPIATKLDFAALYSSKKDSEASTSRRLYDGVGIVPVTRVHLVKSWYKLAADKVPEAQCLVYT